MPASSATDSPSVTSISSASSTSTTVVTTLRVTIIGGSPTVPQIVALVSASATDDGSVTITADYYGAQGAAHVAHRTQQWVLSGQTTYQFSYPIANSAYCGTEFVFTVASPDGAAPHTVQTDPGC